MNEKIIQYTNVDQQLESLKRQNLIINDENFVRDCLKQFGYSNLIKSYRDPYTIYLNGEKQFRSEVSFDQILSLYMLDKNLRNAVMASMLDLEEAIKEAAADVVASAFGVHQDDYLKYHNYQNKRKHVHRFTLTGILEKMNSTLDTDKDPIHHYRTEHGVVPPWILFKSVYFSTIINFVDQFKRPEMEAMVSHLYDTDSFDASLRDLSDLMMDTFFTCHEYRNVAAHGGRIYNYICQNSHQHASSYIGSSVHGFSKLLSMLQLLKYQDPFERLSEALQEEVNRHCNMFPSDVTYLGQTLNINIQRTHYVFVSERSKKYHSDAHCSGIRNAQRIEYAEALEKGYLSCKRCCKEK